MTMKKTITIILTALLSICMVLPVLAEQGETKSPRMSEALQAQTEAAETEEAGEEDGTALSQALSSMQPAGIGADEDGITVEYDGYTAELVSYGVNIYGSSSPDMFLYFHVVNNTDKTLDLYFDDAKVNGIDVLGTGIYDVQPGDDNEDDPDRIWVMSKTGSAEGEEAILNAETVEGALVLQDSESREKLVLKEVTIDLAQLEGERNDYSYSSSDSTDTTSTTDTSVESGPADYTPAPSYRTLKQGDTGEDVKNLQLKLIELGYLYDTADGSFGPRTAQAVKDFNEANGLDGGQCADQCTQELAYSGLANAYTEPWVPLEIGANFYYDPIPEVNTFFFKVEVTNHSRSRTIRGYELSVYYTNVWGDILDGGVTYTQTMTQQVAPGETLYSASFNLGNWYSVDTVWVGVSKIVFDDGEIREPDEVTYYSCQLPSRIN